MEIKDELNLRLVKIQSSLELMKETMLKKICDHDFLYSGVLRYTGFASSGKKSLLVSNFFFAMIATDSALPIACDKN